MPSGRPSEWHLFWAIWFEKRAHAGLGISFQNVTVQLNCKWYFIYSDRSRGFMVYSFKALKEVANNLSTHDNLLTSHYGTSQAIRESEKSTCDRPESNSGSWRGRRDFYPWATCSQGSSPRSSKKRGGVGKCSPLSNQIHAFCFCIRTVL